MHAEPRHAAAKTEARKQCLSRFEDASWRSLLGAMGWNLHPSFRTKILGTIQPCMSKSRIHIQGVRTLYLVRIDSPKLKFNYTLFTISCELPCINSNSWLLVHVVSVSQTFCKTPRSQISQETTCTSWWFQPI